MRIIFTNRVWTRVVGDYVWSKDNGHSVAINDAETVAGLLTHEGFAIDPHEPLLQIMTSEQATLLAVEAGVATAVDLAGLNKAAIKKTAKTLQITEATIQGWVDAAKGLTDHPDVLTELIEASTAVAAKQG